jgi:hypothetical protein
MKIKITTTLFIFMLCAVGVNAQWEVQNIDANNINAPVEADGFLFHNNTTNASFEVPKLSGKYCIYASNLWMGGLDQNGILHLAAQTYKQNGTDFWPGPLTTNGSTLPPSTWNNIWHIDRASIDNHITNYNTQGYQMPQDIIDWPGRLSNGVNQIFAPFVDYNNNGTYDPSYGDYPNVLGDEALYLMYNDKYAAHGETGAIPIEAEVYSTVYAYNSTGSNLLDNTVFVRHRIRNRSQINTYNNFYVGIWNDFEIGYYADDLIGTDINRNMVYGYNASNVDSIYGNNPPAIGVKILNHNLHNSMFYDNTGVNFYGNNPNSSNHYYNYLRSLWKDDMPLNYGLEGYQTSLGSTNFCFSGNTDPNFTQSWDMTTPKDYRIIGAAGPFTIVPNGYITIDVAYIYAKGNNGNSLPELGIAADVVQNFYTATINSMEDNAKINDIQIYPNPAQDFIAITSHQLLKSNTIVSIYDITGKLILEEDALMNNKLILNVSTLNAGVYFVKLKSEDGLFTQKFIKK